MPANHIIAHQHSVTPAERAALNPHQPACLWFTGLSGSGKSTIANAVELRLHREYRAHTYLLDGDNLRRGLNRDLGFSLPDRAENIRRLSEVAHLMVEAGLIVLTAFISPLQADRALARQIVGRQHFFEIYVACPLDICIARDPKGLYQKAIQGEITDFTGIHSPYEPPASPELTLNSHLLPLDDIVQRVLDFLLDRKVLPAHERSR